MDIPAYYHIRDPIENLRIKVTIRKVSYTTTNQQNRELRRTDSHRSSASSGAADAHKPVSQSIKWQEKIFGPREFLRYTSEQRLLTKIGLRHQTKLEDEYRAHFKDEKNRAPYASRVDDDVTVFTFVDRDGYIPPKELHKRLTTSTHPMSELGNQVTHLSHRTTSKPQPTQPDANGGHLFREFPFRIMYIMAAVDVTKEDVKNGCSDVQEVVLCTVKLNSNGLLEVTPSFSDIISEEEVLRPESSDKGDCLISYKFSTKRGSVYEYILENDSETRPEDLDLFEEIRMYEDLLDEKSVRNWETRAGIAVTSRLAQDEARKFFVFMELVSLHGFDGRSLYVQYQARIPDDDGWEFAQAKASSGSAVSSSAGVTQSASNIVRESRAATLVSDGSAEEAVAHLCFPIEAEIVQKSSADENVIPCYEFVFQVMSVDWWERHQVVGYGYLQIPLVAGSYDKSVSCWVPTGTIRDRMTNFFIGGANYLEEPVEDVSYARSGRRQNLSVERVRSKFGLRTESTGRIRARYSVIEQHHPSDEDGGMQTSRHMKRAVSDIIGSLRRRGSPRRTSSIARSLKNEEISSFLKQVKETRLSLLSGPPVVVPMKQVNEAKPTE